MFLSRYPLPFYLSSLSIFFIYFFTFFLFTYFFFLVRFFASLAPFLKRTHKSEKSFFSFFLSSAETFLFLHRSIHLKHATYGRIYIYMYISNPKSFIPSLSRWAGPSVKSLRGCSLQLDHRGYFVPPQLPAGFSAEVKKRVEIEWRNWTSRLYKSTRRNDVQRLRFR